MSEFGTAPSPLIGRWVRWRRDVWGLLSRTVLLAYVTECLSGEPPAGDEELEVRVFRPDEIPWPEIAFSSTRDALREYLQHQGVAS